MSLLAKSPKGLRFTPTVFQGGGPEMSTVSWPTGQAMSSCVPGEGLPPQHWVLSVMTSVKVIVMDWGSYPRPARRVHR